MSAIIRPRFLVHLVSHTADPIPFSSRDLYLPASQHIHLMAQNKPHTRCGKPREAVSKAWDFSVWSLTLCSLGEYCPGCWYGTDRVQNSAQKVRG
jgi:hypothetical protein